MAAMKKNMTTKMAEHREGQTGSMNGTETTIQKGEYIQIVHKPP
jgi:hypothetical protein